MTKRSELPGIIDLMPTRSRKLARPRFEYWRAWNGDWYFHGVARNGKIVLPSEGYTRKANCLKGIEAAKTIAASDVLIEIEEPF